MRKSFTFVLIASAIGFAACKDKKANEGESATATTQPQQETKASDATPVANQPKEYKVNISPDSALLGKGKEALIKITGASAVVLQDPDGKDNGIELTVKLTLTNKQQIGKGSGIHVDYPNSRLQLDNGNNITCDNGSDFLRADPESTSKEESWVYKIPAGAKPKALNLFLDETRVSVNVTLE